MKAAVLGSPITHSLSPVLHRAAYQALGLTGWSYQAIECDAARLPGVLAGCGPGWAGLSLTMPLKRAVLPLLDHVGPLVREVGAANTVVFSGGQRHGHNTDVPGMIAALAEAGVTGLPAPATVLILGGGATACSALAAVRGLGAAQATAAVRDPARAQDLLAAAARLAIGLTLTDFGKPDVTAPHAPPSPRPPPVPPIFMPTHPPGAPWPPAPCWPWFPTPAPPRCRSPPARPAPPWPAVSPSSSTKPPTRSP